MRRNDSPDKSPHVERDYLRQDEANAVIDAAGRVGRRRLRDQVLLRLMYRHACEHRRPNIRSGPTST